VRPARKPDLETVIGILQDVTGAAACAEGGRATVAIPGPDLLPAVVRRLDDAGVLVNELELRRATLDEVFLAITGRQTQDRSPGNE